MEYRTLVRSNLSISVVGFGSMSLDADTVKVDQLIHRAIDLGINFFDTADLYAKGMNEVALGKALKSKRGQVLISTKVGNQWRPDGSGWDWNPRPEHILSSIDQSLQRLQTDHIDLYQLHGGTIDDPIDEIIETFERLQQQGKIRYYGISSIRPNVIREYVKRSSMVSVMMQYSLLDRRPEESIFELLRNNNIGILARGPIAQGLLVNKAAREYLNYTREEVAFAASAVRKCSGNDRSPAQTSIRFVLQHPAVTSVITGIRTSPQLEEAAAAVNSEPLTEQQMESLKNSISPNFYEQHR